MAKVDMIISELKATLPRLYQMNNNKDDMVRQINDAAGFPDKVKVLIDYYQKHTDEDLAVASRMERICQLILTNPWLCDQVEWSSAAERMQFMTTVDALLYLIDYHRRNTREMREELAKISLYIH